MFTGYQVLPSAADQHLQLGLLAGLVSMWPGCVCTVHKKAGLKACHDQIQRFMEPSTTANQTNTNSHPSGLERSQGQI